MPMLDVYIPAGALSETAEAKLVGLITDILISYEGFDTTDPVTRSVSWAFLHRPEAVYVGGELPDTPRYKVVVGVPEGQLDDASRAAVVAEVTDAVLDAEEGRHPRDASRVWVFILDIPDGRWGGRGQIARLPDILMRLTAGERAEADRLATERLTAARRGS